MAALSASATSLAVAVAHAVTFLTRPLATRLAASTFNALQTALEANLAAAFAATWAPHDPTRGSGRRVLSFAPGALPPRPVYKACVAAGVDWSMWGPLLGDKEFDLAVDPGCVSVRISNMWAPPTCCTIWPEEQQQQSDFVQTQRSRGVLTPQPQKTLAQRLIEDDAADEEVLFSLLAAEMREPAWKSPVTDAFPAPSFGAIGAASALANPAASFLGHSRSSSRSSVNSASTSSSFVSDDALSSCGSLSSVSTGASSSAYSDAGSIGKKSGHGRSRSTRVFIDMSRNEVTPYDGGKTTVLTGGVMLGAPPARNTFAGSRNKLPRF
ncbi:uncharacterized protein FOMMEDRAFT_146282 [Fomitiporia mediterranea MF3/22]|uniref:uncharacterized protein n=1 Tax=Fomitiporia mediterranea (strain MF3/22) TaxID=694068 RepID=UPI0004408EA0|nr:uncharacterized protein FOMMEDRAFT_146282 [Fomitiporia mediterranea MF3/22]EJD04302.1 hypothetical protein FOMMEDRAFT_146282 [Fomitiporia mediterranea MF3/22]